MLLSRYSVRVGGESEERESKTGINDESAVLCYILAAEVAGTFCGSLSMGLADRLVRIGR